MAKRYQITSGALRINLAGLQLEGLQLEEILDTEPVPQPDTKPDPKPEPEPEPEPIPAPTPSPQPDSVLLDDFSVIRHPVSTASALWSQRFVSGTTGRGECRVENGELVLRLENSNVYLNFQPVWRPGGIDYLHDFVMGDWRYDYYNRMRFWILIPPGQEPDRVFAHNADVGTFVRKKGGNRRSEEDGGNHWYHGYNLESSGHWHQIIVDTHPNHRRGASGGVELGDQEYPTGQEGWNYFDAMTRFYTSIQPTTVSYPAEFRYKGFELFRDHEDANVEQVSSLHGVWIPETNQVRIGWNRRKDELVNHHIRYAAQDIHVHGWDAYSPVDSVVKVPNGISGYCQMRWWSTDVPSDGPLWIAIKPANSERFRQIRVR